MIFDSNITAEGAMNFIFIGNNLNKFSIDTNIKQNVLPREDCHYIGRLFYEAKEATNCLYMDVEPQSSDDCDMTCETLGSNKEESYMD